MKRTLLLFLLLNIPVVAQESWQEKTAIADSLELAFNSLSALSYRQEAIALATEKSPDTLVFLKTLEAINKGESSFTSSENFETAYRQVEEGVLTLEKMGARPERLYQDFRRLYIYSHNYLRDMNATEANIDKSIFHHFKSAKIDSLTLLKTMHSSGVISRELGKLDKALETFKKAESFYKMVENPDPNTLGAIYADMAFTYHFSFLDIPEKRAFYLNKSIALFEGLENPNYDYLTSLYVRLSDHEKTKGNFEAALNFLKKGFELYDSNKDRTQTSRMGDLGVKKEMQYYHFLVQIHSMMNNEPEMLKALAELERYGGSKKLDAIEFEFLTLGYLFLGEYYEKKDKEKSLSYFGKGLELSENATEFDFVPDFKIALARTLLDTKEKMKGKGLLDEVLRTPTMIPAIEKELLTVKTLYALTDINENEFLFNIELLLSKASEDGKKLNIREMETSMYVPGPVLEDAELLLRLADAVANRNAAFDATLSMKLYELALIHFESNIDNQPLSKKVDNLYKGILKGLFLGMMEYDSTYDFNKKIVERAENIESRFLFTKFNQNRSFSAGDKANEFIDKEQQLRAKITYLKRKRLKDTLDDAVKKELFESERTLKSLERTIETQYTDMHNYARPDYELKREMYANKTILKFYKIVDDLFRLEIGDTVIRVHKIEKYASIEKKVKEILEAIKKPSNNFDRGYNQLDELYRELVAGVNFKKELCIIPDAVLHFLPFEILRNQDSYLLEKYDVSYAINLSFLESSDASDMPREVSEVAFYAPSYNSLELSNQELAVRGGEYDLEGAQEEIQEISSFVNGVVYIGENASKENFQKNASKSSVLHLSMHSFLNDMEPELSCLVFADSNSDNKLFISELYGLNLSADMAVLSACNTGVGGYGNGQGVVSMSRAFTYAGVPSTVSSLWSAPDLSTKEIMVDFYEKLKSGKNKSQSLREAKLAYLKRTKNTRQEHPFYWAGFVLHGNAESLYFEKDFPIGLIVLFGSIIIGIMFFLIKKKL